MEHTVISYCTAEMCWERNLEGPSKDPRWFFFWFYATAAQGS